MTLRKKPIPGLSLLLAVLLVAEGCAPRIPGLERTSTTEAAAVRADDEDTWLKAHYRDGRVAIFDSWQVLQRTVEGDGVLLGADRDTLAVGPFVVPLDSFVLFETDRLTPGRSAPGLAVMTVVIGVVGFLCALNPKACFGSCPTFYAGGDGDEHLVAEGFSSSVTPTLEATDLDALWRVRPVDGVVVLQMKNEALETHAIRHADLLAVPRGPGERVLADGAGAFRAVSGLNPPAAGIAAEGDIAELLRAPDAKERTSLADSFDLATREVIDLRFDAPATGDLGLVVRSRQSLMSTYLFYHALSLLGAEAGSCLALLERGGMGGAQSLLQPSEALGFIEVQLPDGAGGWRTVGEVGETGPLALNVHLLPLPAGCDASRVRLRLTKGHWRLDWVALATLGEAREAVRLPPSAALRDGFDDPETLDTLRDPDHVLAALPGDAVSLVYELPPGDGDWELFLEARGWYLEWMRQEWLGSPDLAAASRLLGDPAGSLRRLAPAYKSVESGMEEIFWGSRYVRAAR
ncbi:MAG: hypothetical protein Q7W56_03395 [Candidatus Latescibacteria bacterium]|nr:hypothetical protein [Candidatus Latescibacterota bacterium]